MIPLTNAQGIRLITCSSCGHLCEYEKARIKKVRRRDGAMAK